MTYEMFMEPFLHAQTEIHFPHVSNITFEIMYEKTNDV